MYLGLISSNTDLFTDQNLSLKWGKRKRERRESKRRGEGKKEEERVKGWVGKEVRKQ
jgi:hypothetical protein